LLTVDDRPSLHEPDRILNLLQDHGPEKMWLVFVFRPLQEAISHPHDVIPERFPLTLLVPDVWALEQWDDQPLRLHEHHLRCANLSFHRSGTSGLQ